MGKQVKNMRLYFDSNKQYIEIDQGIDLSISFGRGGGTVNAWYLDDPMITPVKTDSFVGSVEEGAPVNFNNIFFNPHAHVTHTESLGHITKDFHSVNQIKHPLFYKAEVISIAPALMSNGDRVITLNQIKKSLARIENVEALVLRTLPNAETKKQARYSHTNPPYLEAVAATFLRSLGVKHLLVDLPSVDKEEDGGELAFHHTFWAVPENPDYSMTITEFVFVPDVCQDGEYLLNLQVAPIENDASPSRPVLYKILKV